MKTMQATKTYQCLVCRIGESPQVADLTMSQIADITGRPQQCLRPRHLPEMEGWDMPQNIYILCDDAGRLHPEAIENRFGIFGDFVLVRAVGNSAVSLTTELAEELLAIIGEYDEASPEA